VAEGEGSLEVERVIADGWYHSTGQIIDMAPGFLKVAKRFYVRARTPQERVDAFQKWLGSVRALGGILQLAEVAEVPPETRTLFESHAQECLAEMSRLELPDELVVEVNQLRELLERKGRSGPPKQAEHAAFELVTSGARRLAEVVASALLRVIRRVSRVVRR
jgi:hypothetical protein